MSGTVSVGQKKRLTLNWFLVEADYGLDKIRDGNSGCWAHHNQIGGAGMKDRPGMVLHGVTNAADGVRGGGGVGKT